MSSAVAGPSVNQTSEALLVAGMGVFEPGELWTATHHPVVWLRAPPPRSVPPQRPTRAHQDPPPSRHRGPGSTEPAFDRARRAQPRPHNRPRCSYSVANRNRGRQVKQLQRPGMVFALHARTARSRHGRYLAESSGRAVAAAYTTPAPADPPNGHASHHLVRTAYVTSPGIGFAFTAWSFDNAARAKKLEGKDFVRRTPRRATTARNDRSDRRAPPRPRKRRGH